MRDFILFMLMAYFFIANCMALHYVYIEKNNLTTQIELLKNKPTSCGRKNEKELNEEVA